MNEENKIIKHKKKNKKRHNKVVELWTPIKTWIDSYRCHVCHIVMSKREPSLSPQRITSCGHITCAKCIVQSYLLEMNPMCPVAGCGIYINPEKADLSVKSTLHCGCVYDECRCFDLEVS